MTEPLPVEQPLAITLKVHEWSVVLGALNEAPYRLAAPVIAQISEQAKKASNGAASDVQD